jgi:PAS domain S-box-containing protein
MREYNAVLVNKLEAKTRELELKNAELAAANTALEESRARAAGIIASAMDAIVTVEQDGRILLFNAAAEQMFRAPAAQWIGRPIDELLPERLRGGALWWRVKGITSSELGARGAVAGRRVDGEEFPIEASVSRIEIAGRELVTIILRDITERQRAETALRQVSKQMRALALRLEHIREQERTRIAREIHDVLAQELTRLKIDLVWLGRRTGKPIDEATRALMGTRITEALAQADVAISTVQRIATELRPVILDSLGLSAAVEWQAEDFARRTGIACHARTPGAALTLDRERATALFRILQESLTNVARHAHASHVDIQLASGAGYVALTVRDDGRGIAVVELADPFAIGLAGMRERAQAFGGTVEIAPAGAGGTVVAVRLPLDSTSGGPVLA